MTTLGRLYAFEGADAVGKSDLSIRFAEHLNSIGVPCQRLSFPDDRDGSLASIVHRVQHRPEHGGGQSLTATTTLLLHVAAHVEAIERRILPALRDGVAVVLDPYWWSSFVRAVTAGASPSAAEAAIKAERAVWDGVEPSAVIVVRRGSPLRPECRESWRRCCGLYEEIARAQAEIHAVFTIKNEGPQHDVLLELLTILKDLVPSMRQGEGSQSVRDLGSAAAEQAPYVHSSTLPVHATKVYDTYWTFAAARQEIFFRRLHAEPAPWTADPILRRYKFTNAFRASDRVSQFLIKSVIYEGSTSPEEVFFRVILFKLFNRIDTWKLLVQRFGRITYETYAFDEYDRVLTNELKAGRSIYSAAYIMPSGSRTFGTARKHQAHLRLLERMMEDEVPLRLTEAKSMAAAFKLLRSYPLLGDFLAYQYVIDLNYSEVTNFSEMEFVMPGPGARDGIRKCFPSSAFGEADLVRLVTDRQEAEFERLGVAFRSLWGRPLQLIDCQNLFCEVDKYARVAHPDIVGISGRSRIKQVYRHLPTPISFWYPPKWGLNEAVATEQAGASPAPEHDVPPSAVLRGRGATSRG